MDYDDHGHIAMPKLVGGPKYSRPPVGVKPVERPVGPDDLPLASERTEEEQALARELGIDGLPTAVVGGTSPSSTGVSTTAISEAGGHVAHPNGSWTLASGTIATGSRSRHRGFGLFRRHDDRSGVG